MIFTYYWNPSIISLVLRFIVPGIHGPISVLEIKYWNCIPGTQVT